MGLEERTPFFRPLLLLALASITLDENGIARVRAALFRAARKKLTGLCIDTNIHWYFDMALRD